MLKVFNNSAQYISTHAKYKNAQKVLEKMEGNGYIFAEDCPQERKRLEQEYITANLQQEVNNLGIEYCMLSAKGKTKTKRGVYLAGKIEELKEDIQKIESNITLEKWYS